MRITWNELTVGFDPSNSDGLLQEWRWLIRDTQGRILWLDVGTARVT